MYKTAFSITPPATAFSTAVATLIYPGPNIKSALACNTGLRGGRPNWWDDGWYIHITDLIVTCSTTANIIYIMRPLNWTTVKTAMAKNVTAMVLTDDPGIYSTNYRYPLPGQTWNPPGTVNTVGPCASDNALAASDYVAIQLLDGTYHLSTVSSGTFAAVVLTTGTPNFTGGTVAAGSPCFWFGVNSDTVPATKTVHMIRTPIVSTQQVNLLAGWGGNASAVGGGGGASTGYGIPSLMPGEPLLIYNPNASATTTVDFIGGYFAKY